MVIEMMTNVEPMISCGGERAQPNEWQKDSPDFQMRRQLEVVDLFAAIDRC